MKKVVGFIDFDKPLQTTIDCLGKTFTIKIHSTTGNVKTPRIEKMEGSKVSGTNLVAPDRTTFKNKTNWGHLLDDEAYIEGLKIEFKIDPKKITSLRSIKSNLADWLLNFKENLTVYGLNLDTPSVSVSKEAKSSEQFFLYNGENEIDEKIDKSIIIHFNRTISIVELRKAIRFANGNKRPVLELKLLKNAYESFVGRDYRKLVLDSATALEVLLTKLLKQHLKVDQKLLSEILRTSNSISKKRELLKVIGFELPNHKYRDEIEKLRNRAVHAGETPKDSDAIKAYKIVKGLIYKMTKERFE